MEAFGTSSETPGRTILVGAMAVLGLALAGAAVTLAPTADAHDCSSTFGGIVGSCGPCILQSQPGHNHTNTLPDPIGPLLSCSS